MASDAPVLSASDLFDPHETVPVFRRLRYRFQCVKTKPAIVVLFISAALFCSVCTLRVVLLNRIHSSPCQGCFTYATILTFTSVVFYPIFGYLADVYFKRFNIMTCGLLLIWSGALVTSAATSLDSFNVVGSTTFKAAYWLALVGIGVGMVFFHSNLIPFALEQLHSSPAEEIVAFIHAYVWLELIGVALSYSATCILNLHPTHGYWSVSLFCFVLVTAAVLILAVFSPSLVVERAARRYTLRGLLTELLVELRMRNPALSGANLQQRGIAKFVLVVGVVLCLFGLTVITNVGQFFVVDLLSSAFKQVCYVKVLYVAVPYVVVIPAYHFIVHPLFHRYVPGILNRATIGLGFSVAGAICSFVLVTAGQYSRPIDPSPNCFLSLKDPAVNVFELSKNWLLIINVINAFASFTLFVPIYEFVSAKSPYDAKGLLIGLLYGVFGIGRLIGVGLLFAFAAIGPSCGFWYYGTHTVLCIGGLCLFAAGASSIYPKLLAKASSHEFDTVMRVNAR